MKKKRNEQGLKDIKLCESFFFFVGENLLYTQCGRNIE